MKTLIVDNYDSYTYNIFQYVSQITGVDPVVVKNDSSTVLSEINKYDCIILSPGPGNPIKIEDFGICKDILSLRTNIPILGICLGHQGIASEFGGIIKNSARIIHGEVDNLNHDNSELFEGITQGFEAVRYHSLIAEVKHCKELKTICWNNSKEVMGIKHISLPYYGLQFHPESILTKEGYKIIENFISNVVSTHTKKEKYHLFSKSLALSLSEIRIFEKLYKNEQYAFWLDSNMIGEVGCSYMGSLDGKNSKVIKYDSKTRMIEVITKEDTYFLNKSIFEFLEEELTNYKDVKINLPGFKTGFVGYLGYDIKGECGGKYHIKKSDYPDSMFIFSNRIIQVKNNNIKLIALGTKKDRVEIENWFKKVENKLMSEDFNDNVGENTDSINYNYKFIDEKEEYIEKIKKIKEYLYKGDSYEVNLTTKLTGKTNINPLDLYKTLRVVNPAPYAAFIRFNDIHLLSSSPERFVKVSADGNVEVRPIKGTIKRSQIKNEDDILKKQLENSVKDRAENLMITDLLRNDLGKISKSGSVVVDELMKIETYQTVHQMVSVIKSTLKEDVTSINCLEKLFPAGSMTGAPKIRTMEIIDELESESRGIYSGALGYISIDGEMDMSVIIRTIVYNTSNNIFEVGAGGAITLQSNENEEYEEMKLKSNALIKSINISMRQEADLL